MSLFGSVLEGEFAFARGEEPPRTRKAGETFDEPGGVVHRAARNPSTRAKTRGLAVILHPRDATEITTPAGTE